MVSRLHRLAFVAFSLIAATNCNLEVGNPDGDVTNMTRLQSSLQVEFTAKQPCSTIATDCTAVPVVLNSTTGTSAAYIFEISSARMQLASITLAPYSPEAAITQIDLMTGSSVNLSVAIDPAMVQSIAFTFSGNNTLAAPTFTLSGNLVTTSATGQIAIPLSLVYSQQVSAQTPVSAAGATIAAAQFDPAAWFNFSASPINMGPVLSGITSGACKEQNSASCLKYESVISQQVSLRISHSLSIRTQPTAQKPISKGNLGR